MNKAIILAGGKGTRLYPITETTPKPATEFIDKTLCEHLINQLSRYGISQIMITVAYKKDVIKNLLGSSYSGITIKYFEEEAPLGTAGSLKCAKELLDLTDDDNLLVVSGDCVCDFDFSKIINHHTASKADVTIVTAESDFPLEYGVVLCEENGIVYGLNEKPSWSQVSGNRVNTGIYVISPSVTSLIPDKEYDYSKDLFPKMIEMGYKLYSYNANGYWCDVGSIESYYTTVIDALAGKIADFKPENCADFSSLRSNGVKIIEPCYISKDCEIGKGTVIGPKTSISSKCIIGENSEIAASVLHNGAIVGCQSRIEGSTICKNAKIGSRVVMCGGTVVGEDAKVEDKSYIPPNEIVTKKQNYANNHSSRKETCIVFEEDGLQLGNIDSVPYEKCERIGLSLANIIGKHSKIGVMYDNSYISQQCASSVIYGLSGGCTQVFDFGKGFETLSKLAAYNYKTDCNIYIHERSGNLYCNLISQNTLDMPRDFERKIEAEYKSASHYQRYQTKQKILSISSISSIYFNEIYDNATRYSKNNGYEDLKICIDAKTNNEEFEIFKEIFKNLGGKITEKKEIEESCSIYIRVNEDGEMLFSQSNYEFDSYLAIAAILKEEIKTGTEIIALPLLMPYCYDKNLDSTKIIRYPTNTSKALEISNSIIRNSLWCRDNAILCARFLSLLQYKKINISGCYHELPKFAYIQKQIVLPNTVSKSFVINSFHADKYNYIQDSYEGITVSYPEGSIRIVPGKSNTFKLYAESLNSEVAREICDITEKQIIEKQ